MPIARKANSPFFWYDFRFAGNRYRGSTRTTNKQAARHVESEMIRQLAAGDVLTTFGKRAPLLRDFLPTFLASFDQNMERARKTKKYYHQGATLLLASPLAEFPIDRITTSVVASVTFPHSGSTANNAIRTLRRALGHAVETRQLTAVPKMGLRPEKSREAIYTAEQEQAMLQRLGGISQDAADVFVFCMDLGARPGEICAVEWPNIHWLLNLLEITGGKTEAAARMVGMTERVVEILKRRLRAQEAHPRLKGTPWVFPSVRVSRNGKMGHIHGINKAFLQARKIEGLSEDLVLYSARHTFGTEFMAATKDLKLTMSAMGHVDVKTAMRYQHPDTAQVGNVMNERNAKRKKATTKSGHLFGHTSHAIQ